MIFFYIVYAEKYQQQDKKTVFDIIINTDEESIKYQLSRRSNHATVSDVEKSVKNQDLRSIFVAHQQRHREKSVIYQLKRRGMKKQFLEAIKWKNKMKFNERRQDNILVNFCFLTKLS